MPDLWLGAGGHTGKEWGAVVTYEMAVARAFLRALERWSVRSTRGDFKTRIHALRRLRVRAGLTP